MLLTPAVLLAAPLWERVRGEILSAPGNQQVYRRSLVQQQSLRGPASRLPLPLLFKKPLSRRRRNRRSGPTKQFIKQTLDSIHFGRQISVTLPSYLGIPTALAFWDYAGPDASRRATGGRAASGISGCGGGDVIQGTHTQSHVDVCAGEARQADDLPAL